MEETGKGNAVSIRDYLQDLLGINDLRQNQHVMHRDTLDMLRGVRKQVAITNNALGRVIAKVDPRFLQDPLSKEARAESDRIGQEALRRIEAEHMARRHTEGKL